MDSETDHFVNGLVRGAGGAGRMTAEAQASSPSVGLAVLFALGMLCHWRFWRWALPLSVIAFCFGYWRGLAQRG